MKVERAASNCSTSGREKITLENKKNSKTAKFLEIEILFCQFEKYYCSSRFEIGNLENKVVPVIFTNCLFFFLFLNYFIYQIHTKIANCTKN